MTKAGFRLTRWADDFVVVCPTYKEAEKAMAMARAFLREKLGVELHPEKTRIVHVTDGFELLLPFRNSAASCSRSSSLNRTTYFFTIISFPAMIASIARVAAEANHQILSNWLKRPTSVAKDSDHIVQEEDTGDGGATGPVSHSRTSR